MMLMMITMMTDGVNSSLIRTILLMFSGLLCDVIDYEDNVVNDNDYNNDCDDNDNTVACCSCLRTMYHRGFKTRGRYLRFREKRLDLSTTEVSCFL